LVQPKAEPSFGGYYFLSLWERIEVRVNAVAALIPAFSQRDCVAIPFMVREPHHERYCLIANSITYPFALSVSKGSE
jgi:hypothetical protein